MGLILGFISGQDFARAGRVWICSKMSLNPLHIGKPCEADDYHVYVVMDIQSSKKKIKNTSICGQPVCAPSLPYSLRESKHMEDDPGGKEHSV